MNDSPHEPEQPDLNEQAEQVQQAGVEDLSEPTPDYDYDTEERDDTVIARALKKSLAVFLVVAAVVAVILAARDWFTHDGPPITKRTPLQVPQVPKRPEADIPRVPFSDITDEAGIDFVHENGAYGDKLLPETMGGGCAFFDFDNDGDQDVFEQMGGAYLGDKFGNALYRNPGFGNRWIAIQLVGTQSNRSGIGARIHVVISEGAKTRSIYKHVNSGGSFGANPLRQYIGLGNADKIERLEIYWPTSDTTQIFHNVPMDRFIRIQENADQYKILKLKSFSMPPEK